MHLDYLLNLIRDNISAVLVSEYSIFQDFTDDQTRLKVIADGLFTHIGGIVIGMVIGLFFLVPDIAYFFLATNILTIGLFITSSAKEPLPHKEELLWKRAIRHLYIYHSESGIGLSNFSFLSEDSADGELITGGLTGISVLINEMTKRDGNLKAIQQQNANIIFHKGTIITAALISNSDLKILHSKLELLITQFEELFTVYLEPFIGNVSVFEPSRVLVRKIFTEPINM